MGRTREVFDRHERVALGVAARPGAGDEADGNARAGVIVAGGIDAGASVEGVAAVKADEGVVAVAAEDVVGAAETVDDVVAAVAEDVVGAVGDAVSRIDVFMSC